MRGIVMMLAASLLVTANDALVKLALGAAGSAEALFFWRLFALLALLIYAAISGQFGCLLTQCWRLSAGLAGLAVLELDWARFELHDRGLLDFAVWAAGQMVDEEEMKNSDVRMLAASAVPAAVTGMIPLDTPETIGTVQNFILKGRTLSVDISPVTTGNAARMPEAFTASELPISISVMHSPREM
jgi:hypothetical protein